MAMCYNQYYLPTCGTSGKAGIYKGEKSIYMFIYSELFGFGAA
jgi:hypothetical protein